MLVIVADVVRYDAVAMTGIDIDLARRRKSREQCPFYMLPTEPVKAITSVLQG